MSLLITGAKGQLGQAVVQRAQSENRKYIAADRDTLDITNRLAVQAFFRLHTITSVVHCAAYTAVDQAQSDSEMCYAVNVKGTQHLVDMCRELDIALMLISTDYVFDGLSELPYEVNAQRNPLNVYGQSKVDAEDYVRKHLDKSFIVRTSWVFGPYGSNFVESMMRLAQQQTTLSIVSDQIGSPTYTLDLAPVLLELLDRKTYGIYHITNEGVCSWYDFASEIFKLTDQKVELIPIASEAYPTPAQRPRYSVLSKKALDLIEIKRLPDWKDALARYIKVRRTKP